MADKNSDQLERLTEQVDACNMNASILLPEGKAGVVEMLDGAGPVVRVLVEEIVHRADAILHATQRPLCQHIDTERHPRPVIARPWDQILRCRDCAQERVQVLRETLEGEICDWCRTRVGVDGLRSVAVVEEGEVCTLKDRPFAILATTWVADLCEGCYKVDRAIMADRLSLVMWEVEE